MACVLRLPVGLLLRPQHRQQPLGLGWGSTSAKFFPRPSQGPLCITCQAHAQRTEVSASDSTKKDSTGVHTDTSEPYSGWEALDSKSEGDYWAGLLQIGAGVALAVGFALVSHAAYARRGANRDDTTSPVAVQDVLSADRTSVGEQDGAGFAAAEKNSAGLASPERERVSGVAEDVEQGQEVHTEGAKLRVEGEKTQQKAAPGQVSYPDEEVSDLSAEGGAVYAAPVVHDRDIAPGQDSHLSVLVPDEDANPTDKISGLDPDEVEPVSPRSSDIELLQTASVSGLLVGSDTTDQLSGEELQPNAADEGDKAVLTSSESPESALDALPAEPERLTDVTQQDTVVASAAAGLDAGGGFSSSSEIQHLPLEREDIASAATLELPADSQLKDDVAFPALSGDGLVSAEPLSAGAGSDPLSESGPDSHPVSVVVNTGTDQALATLPLPALSEIAQNVTLLVMSSEGESVEISSGFSPKEPITSSVEITAAEPVEDISLSGVVVGTADPDDPDPVNQPTLHSDSLKFGSFGIPAPSTPSAAAQVSPGRVVIPAVVDQVQEQAVAVLQALKVVETGIEAGELCTRREYARWLINASNFLARSSSQKVFPAMYIENITDLAFDDVSPEDPDFPFIQGLAEAGLISSRLTLQDLPATDSASVRFAPDALLSRQDLISWKLALEGGTQTVDKETLQARSGFIDIDRIHEDAWPAIFADLSAGEDSIIATAFGYTRRFHPDKPTTKAQAAVALVLGESAAVVADESARLQAEKIADQAVQEQLELEARALQEVDAALKEMLNLEREGRVQAQASADELKSQLDSLKSERDQERLTLLREHAVIDSDKQIISEYRRQLEEELEALGTLRAELAIEREREGSARAGIEQEREGVRMVKSALEIEKQALALARQWAEEEARNARAHSKVLEEVRKRWENQGIEVAVDGKLADDNIPEQTWKYTASVDGASETSPSLSESTPVEQSDLSGPSDVEELRDTVVEFIQNGRRKVLEFVRKVVQALRDVLAQLRAQAANKLSSVSEATENAWQVSASYGRSKAQELRQGASSGVTGVSSSLLQGTRKVADALKEEAGKIAQKFKTT